MEYDQRDYDMVKDHDKWPSWPVLPMKRQKSSILGYMHDAYPTRVYFGNMFRMNTETDDYTDYVSIEELLEDGWYVD